LKNQIIILIFTEKLYTMTLSFLLLSALYTGLKHSHSGLRYLVILVIFTIIIKSIIGIIQKKTYTNLDKTLNLIGMSLAHTQLIIGLVLWFISAEVAAGDRYWKWEHPTAMILAIVAFTLGYSITKRTEDHQKKHTTTLRYYAIGTALVIVTLLSKNLLF
jgi:uncharacterized membrane protein